MGSPGFPRLRGPDELATRTQDGIAGQLQPVAKALAATPIMGAAAPPWQLPDLLNGFANAGGALAVAGYHRDALGYVHMKGELTHAAGCAAGTQILLLPLAYRPRETMRIAVPVTPGAQWITITGAGVVSTGFLIAAGEQIGLAVTFLAEQ